MSSFNKKYFTKNYPQSLIDEKKKLNNKFWIRYLRRLKPNGKLLDIGCGEGFFLEVAQKHWETYGVDISEYAINKAKKRCKKTRLYVQDATKLDFDNNQFDIIVCFDVLEHLPEPKLCLLNCNRILKANGLLLISTPNLHSLGRIWKQKNWFGYRDSTHISILSKKVWIEFLAHSNFSILKIFYDWLWDSPYFSKAPVFLQHLIFKIPSTLLFCLGIHSTKVLGENLYITTIKKYDYLRSTE